MVNIQPYIGLIMKRILILGCCGAGKSTLARSLSDITGLDIIHLDQEYWNPGWVETSKDIWEEKVEELVKHDRWIMDGNYSGSLDIRLPRADTIIYLDRSTWTCLYRVIKRIWKYNGTVRPDMKEGCQERFNWDFLHYVAVFNHVTRKRVLNKIKKLGATKKMHIFKSDSEVQKFLDGVKAKF